MQFGLFGSAAARRGGPEFDSSEGFRDFIDYNVEAETLGFYSTFVVEHHFTGYGQVSATINLLTWLGARTSRLRLGTAVIVLPWHNPVLLAEQAATLDLLSGGRLDFGIGKGYRYNEFAGFCVPMEEADARFDECLEVILRRGPPTSPSRTVENTGSSTTSSSSRRPHSGGTRLSGWVRAARTRSAGSRPRASTCCSGNTPRRGMSPGTSPSTDPRWKPGAGTSIRCRSG
jgi:alkanesulfonate monooxygenase SsuD/methylene tetrahydromethanopterin reductase-like flavin-dependent oxidoreductase (luciferase family)